VTASDLRDVAVLARFGTPGTKAWSASGAAKAIKGLFERLAGELPQRDADAMVKASAHWLRHSHAAHALQGRSGQTPPLPLTVVRRHLGHASLATTSGYLAAVRDWSTSAVTAAGDGQAAAA